MRHYLWSVLLVALISLTYARAQINFSDSLRISLLTCTPGPDAYERFGHSGVRIQDLKQPQLDVTFHYGVFSFNTPHFIFRFVKGETDYQLGALFTRDFIDEYHRRGLGMVEQSLRLDSMQAQTVASLLLENYRPENRTYRYSYFFDNCATRPYRLIGKATEDKILYDTVNYVRSLTLREMVQEKTHTGNWLDFGIALAVARRADEPTSFEEQLFLPDYLSHAAAKAQIPARLGESLWYMPLVVETDTLLLMTPEVKAAIDASDPISPSALFAIILLLAFVLAAYELRRKQAQRQRGIPEVKAVFGIASNLFDTVFFLLLGLTGCVVWFLNFFSLHPAVDHNLNCLWLLPTHVVVAVLLWFKGLRRYQVYYFGMTFALAIIYVICDWTWGQYCPSPFLLLLATLLLRCIMRMKLNEK